jgi:hypothetical protein
VKNVTYPAVEIPNVYCNLKIDIPQGDSVAGVSELI